VKNPAQSTRISLLIFIGILVLDFLSKRWALAHANPTALLPFLEWGLFTTSLKYDTGQDPHEVLRIVHYATFLGPLLLIYFFFMVQFTKKQSLKILTPWISVWIAGLAANILDRMLYGGVLYTFKWGQNGDCLFNLAWVAVWVGLLGSICTGITRRKAILGPRKHTRKFNMINPRFQTLYMAQFLLVCGFLSISLLVFSYTFLKYFVLQYDILIPDAMLNLFVIEFSIILLIFIVLLVFISWYFSSKIAGPLHAFGLYIDKLKDGQNATFRLREDDQLKELEPIAQEIKDHWR
jgi:lipoprotein signal peptidase